MISGTGTPWMFYGNELYGLDKNTKRNAKTQNNDTMAMYLYKMLNYDLDMIEWLNVPDGIDVRYMEVVLCLRGAGVCYKDLSGKYIFVDVALNGGINMYHRPIKYRAYSFNLDVPLDIDNSVICYNNYLRMPDMFELEQFAKRIADVQRTIDINLNHHKMPVIYSVSPKNKLSFKNLWLKITNNEPVVFADKELATAMSDGVVNTQVDYIIDKLQQQKMEIWNEAMVFIGIDNANVNKKERLITDEVNSNNSQIEYSRYSKLNSRRQFCKEFNAMFGTNLWCRFRNNSDKTESEFEDKNPVELEEEKEVVMDEKQEEDKEVVKNE